MKTKTLISILIATMIITTLGFYGTVKADASDVVAKIGETEFTTLKDAVDSIKEGDPATTIKLEKDFVGDGIEVNNKNIVFDFGGHTYTVDKNYAGSAGTKTQAFQLLKGSTVVMKNGTLKIAGEGARMVIQNYSNLTLTDMTLDASTLSQVGYVLSSNCGTVSINGNTSIYAAEGKRAFDMCWAPTKGYSEGTQITVNTTGTIKGVIELDTWGTFSTPILSTLNINNINHEGSFSIEDRSGNYEKQLTITGGTYTTSPMVATGYAVYQTGDKYEVAKAGTITATDKVTVEVAKSADLGISVTEGLEKYLTVTSKDTNIATVSNGQVTGVNNGKTTIEATLADGTLKTIDVVVFKIEESTTETPEVNKEVENIINDVVSGKGVETLTKDQTEAIQAAVNEGKTLKVDVETNAVEESKVKEDSEKAKEIMDENSKVAGYFDINVLIKDKEVGTEITKLTNLPNATKLTVNVSKDLPKVADGYVRTFNVIRVHDGKAEKLDAIDNGDGTVSFASDKFSTYIVTYVDAIAKVDDNNNNQNNTNNTNNTNNEENNQTPVAQEQSEIVNNPITGDNIISFIAIFVVALAGTIVTIKQIKKA